MHCAMWIPAVWHVTSPGSSTSPSTSTFLATPCLSSRCTSPYNPMGCGDGFFCGAGLDIDYGDSCVFNPWACKHRHVVLCQLDPLVSLVGNTISTLLCCAEIGWWIVPVPTLLWLLGISLQPNACSGWRASGQMWRANPLSPVSAHQWFRSSLKPVCSRTALLNAG